MVILGKQLLSLQKDELKPGEMKTIGGFLSKVLVANVDGCFYAISNRCSHLSCSLSRGKLDHYVIRCSCHGSQFNVKTGKVINGPARKPLKTYLTKVEGAKVIVEK